MLGGSGTGPRTGYEADGNRKQPVESGLSPSFTRSGRFGDCGHGHLPPFTHSGALAAGGSRSGAAGPDASPGRRSDWPSNGGKDPAKYTRRPKRPRAGSSAAKTKAPGALIFRYLWSCKRDSRVAVYVPSDQEARYASCSWVSSSMRTPMECSFRRAISRSISRGTVYT